MKKVNLMNTMTSIGVMLISASSSIKPRPRRDKKSRGTWPRLFLVLN